MRLILTDYSMGKNTMQSTQDKTPLLWAVNAHEQALGAQLIAAQITLSELLNAREKAIKPLNGFAWDAAQYRLDDMQQNLGDLIETLYEIQSFNSLIHK